MTDYRSTFASTPDGELFTTNTEREKNFRVALSGSQAAAATNFYGLVDLSDTVNWPHTGTAGLHFSYLSLFIDKAAAARGSVQLGIITRIDGTSADITFVAAATFVNNDSSSFNVISNFAPSQLKCNVVGGKVIAVKTNTIETNITAVNTGTPIAFGPSGTTFTPGVGDAIVRIITTTGGALNWGLTSFYHGDPVTT